MRRLHGGHVRTAGSSTAGACRCEGGRGGGGLAWHWVCVGEGGGGGAGAARQTRMTLPRRHQWRQAEAEPCSPPTLLLHPSSSLLPLLPSLMGAVAEAVGAGLGPEAVLGVIPAALEPREVRVWELARVHARPHTRAGVQRFQRGPAWLGPARLGPECPCGASVCRQVSCGCTDVKPQPAVKLVAALLPPAAARSDQRHHCGRDPGGENDA